MPQARFLTYNDRAYRREKVAAAYKAGAAIPELAERYGLSRNRIYAVLSDAKVPRRQRPRQVYRRDDRGRFV